jgi:hypothetical protein
VGVLARRSERPPATLIEDLPAHLATHERPEPTLYDYDRLLAGAVP